MFDQGDVRFEADLSQGLVLVHVRPALGLPSAAVAAPIAVMDLLDAAAKLQLAISQQMRVALGQITAAPAGKLT